MWFNLIIGFIVVFMIIKKASKGSSKQDKEFNRIKKEISKDLNEYENNLKKNKFSINSKSYPTSRKEYKNSGNSKALWIGKETISVGRYVIKNPFTYYSHSRDENENPSCIIKKMKIGKALHAEDCIGYWPSYKGLTENQRAFYLEWMENGRKTSLKEVGYIFIFFYGLERRVLIENKDKEEIVKEVRRLLELYGDMSGSLKSYLGNFILYNELQDGIKNIVDVDKILNINSSKNELALYLAWHFLKKIPLNAKGMLAVLKRHPECNKRSVVLQRIPKILEKLFIIKYNNEYKEGLELKVSKIDYNFIYRPASMEINNYDNTIFIPNVLEINSQFKPSINMWNESIEELKKISTLVAKGNNVDSRVVYSALPDLLKETLDHPLKSKFQEIILKREKIELYQKVEIKEIAKLIEIKKMEKLTLSQSKEISNLCRELGLSIEPDSNITGKSYKWTDRAILFEKNENENIGNYKVHSLVLELGMVIANSDGVVEDTEINYIVDFLEEVFMLDKSEMLRINALKDVLIENPPSLNGLGKKLKNSLTKKKLELIGKFIIGISAIDGNIDKKEVKTIKALFRIMELDLDLDSLLEKPQSIIEKPIEIIASSESLNQGEAIPFQNQEESIRLDYRKIKEILSNTKEISTILGDIFEEDIEEEILVDDRVIESSELIEVERFEGLASRYYGILDEILLKEQWEKLEFERLSKKHNQMPSGILDVINEWSDEFLGDFLIIEEKEILIVNKDLFKEM